MILVKCDDKACVPDAEDSSRHTEIKGVVRKDVAALQGIEMLPGKLLHPDALGVITAGVDKHFYSNGAFNLIQLVLYLLKQTGPAHLFLSTYSISNESIGTLLKYRDRGEILSVRFLIDNRVRTISPKPFDYLLTSFPDACRCCALHAKVALVWNDTWHISVVGSQNATHNPKLERGIIHTSCDIFEFDLKTLCDEFERGAT